MSVLEGLDDQLEDETDLENREGNDPAATETEAETTDSEQPAAEETDETDSENDENGTSALSKVRREAARYRTQLRDAEKQLESVRSELFHAKVSASGQLADPTDMPVDVELLEDPDALEAAITELIEAKPHLKARRFGSIGQEDKRKPQGVSLGSILRRNA